MNFPALTLPQLPQFPQFPQKKPQPKVTKTVYVEITKRVTQNPICVTAYGNQPPCAKFGLHNQQPQNVNHGHYPKSESEDLHNFETEEELFIEPTAVARMPESTALWNVEDMIEDYMEPSDSREGKYLEFRRTPIVSTPLESIDTDPNVNDDMQYPRLIDQFMGLGKKQTVTKTLFVTKVQRIVDNRVTATLVAENCLPTDRFAMCPPSHHKPGGNHYYHSKPQVSVQNIPLHHQQNKPSSHYHAVKENDTVFTEKQNADNVDFEKTIDSVSDIVDKVQKESITFEE